MDRRSYYRKASLLMVVKVALLFNSASFGQCTPFKNPKGCKKYVSDPGQIVKKVEKAATQLGKNIYYYSGAERLAENLDKAWDSESIARHLEKWGIAEISCQIGMSYGSGNVSMHATDANDQMSSQCTIVPKDAKGGALTIDSETIEILQPKYTDPTIEDWERQLLGKINESTLRNINARNPALAIQSVEDSGKQYQTRGNPVVRGFDYIYGFGEWQSSRNKGSRPHNGLDIVMPPYAPVQSPIDGIASCCSDVDMDPRYTNLRTITIKGIGNDRGKLVKLVYVDGIWSGSMRVSRGTVLGSAQDLSQRYPNMPNHVHVRVFVNKVEVNPEQILYGPRTLYRYNTPQGELAPFQPSTR